MRRYTGLIAAPHTPFGADGALNLKVVEQQCALLVESGVIAAFVCGSTGESSSLTVEERKQVAQRWMEAARGTIPVLVHVGHNCQRDAMELAAHAQKIGAAGISAISPSYFKPSSVDDLVEFLAPVAGAAPDVPFYYYDIPGLTGVRLATNEVLAKGAKRMANLAGVKFTNDDLMLLQECLTAEGGRFEVLFGLDEMLLGAMAMGTRGAIGSTYNYAAPAYQRVIRAFEGGDMETARREQRRAVGMIRVLSRFGVLRAGKAIMGLLGVDCGPVRPPVRAVAGRELMELYEQLRGMDVFARALKAPGQGT